MKRNVSGYASRGTLVINLQDKGVLNYYQSAEKIHDLYGGRMYYKSRSGMTFNGYLNPDPTIPIVLFEGYRSTTKHLTESSKNTIENTDIYIPADKGIPSDVNGFGYNEPVILITGKNIDIMYINQFVEFLGFGDFSSLYEFSTSEPSEPEAERLHVEYEFKYFDNNGTVATKKYKVRYWSNHVIQLPLKLDEYIIASNGIPRDALKYENSTHPVIEKMGIVQTENGEFATLNFHGLVHKFVTPVNSGETIDGYSCYSRTIEDVEYFHLYKAADENKIYHQVWALVDSTWVEYEVSHNLFAFYANPRDIFETEIENLLTNKINKIKILNLSFADIELTIKANPETTISIQDSLHAGNCEYGTRQFIKRYRLNDEVTFAELAAHHSFEQMIKNHSFINAVKIALGKSV